MSIKLPTDKSKLIKKLLVQFKNKQHCTIRQYASLVERLVASAPALKYGWVHVKPFEILKQKNLTKNHMSFNSRMKVPTSRKSRIWLVDS